MQLENRENRRIAHDVKENSNSVGYQGKQQTYQFP